MFAEDDRACSESRKETSFRQINASQEYILSTTLNVPLETFEDKQQI